MTESTDTFFPSCKGALKDYNLDDVFTRPRAGCAGPRDGDAEGPQAADRDHAGAELTRRSSSTRRIPLNTGLGSQIPPPNPNAGRRGGSPRAGRGRGRAGPANPLATPNFICFEPMAGITNALNLAHKGVYKELQYIPPGGTWQESFWIRASGF